MLLLIAVSKTGRLDNQFITMFSLCRFLVWDEVRDNEDHKLCLKPSKKVPTQLEEF